MGYWVVTVAGVAILSVLCDVILPEGQTRKYVKTVFGIVVSFVIIQPIVGLLGGDTLFQFEYASLVEVQSDYLDNVSNRQNKNAIQNLSAILSKNGIDVQSVDVNNAESSVIIVLNKGYSKSDDAVVQQVAGVYFYNYKIVTVWT